MTDNAATAVPLTSGQGTVNSIDELEDTPEGKFKRWRSELDTSKRDRHDWSVRADKVLRRYRDERDSLNSSDKLFNILWSNIEVLKPALYSKPPQPEVNRKFDTESDPARVAAIILERNLDYFVCEHGVFDEVMNQCVFDRLLPGQGTAWVRYTANLPDAAKEPAHKEPPAGDPSYAEHEAAEPPAVEAGEQANQQITDDAYTPPTEQTVCYDYVHWRDFRSSPARVWEEVTWVARRVYMDRACGTKRFGDKFKDVPLNYKESAEERKKDGNQEFGPGLTVVAKAAVWEIWDKTGMRVLWLCEDYPAAVLDEKQDTLRLPDFFPCPKPLLATVTNESIIPIPDYCMYQDQAQELDQATNRISLLMQALKVVGVYDKTQDAIQRLLTEGVDNVMIPCDNWAMFAERGGLKGQVDFFPVEMVSKVLTQLIQDRNTIKQDIYEITGLADIVRGASVASETATAQNLKAKFAGIRINDAQKDIARFASDLLNMSASIICEFFLPDALLLNSGITQEDPDYQFAVPALQLIKAKQVIRHRITVSVDAITEADDEKEQAARVEFLTALGQFMQQGAAAVEAHPQLASMVGYIILWGVRGFKVGRDIEGVIEQGIKSLANVPPTDKPDPKAEQAKAEMAQAEQKHGLEVQKLQGDMAKSQQDARVQQQSAQLELQQQREKNAMELQHMQQEFALKLQFMEKEFALKAGQQQATTAAKVEAAQVDGAIKASTAEQEQQQSAQQHDQNMEQSAAVAEQQRQQAAATAAAAPKDK